jgi:hypothetical protein
VLLCLQELLDAVRNSDCMKVLQLLAQGFDIDMLVDNKCTALLSAVDDGIDCCCKVVFLLTLTLFVQATC